MRWITQDRLQQEDIEFFVADVRELPADAGLETRSLGRQHGGLFVRAGHPLASKANTLAETWKFGIASVRLPEAVKASLAALIGLPSAASVSLTLQCDDIALLRSAMLQTDSVLALTNAAMQADLDTGRRG